LYERHAELMSNVFGAIWHSSRDNIVM